MYITSWIFVAIALYGTYLNTNQDKRGFYFWILSNSAFTIINMNNEMWSQAFLFLVYTILAVRGLVKWR
jgi:hypothetical protein